MSIWNAIVLGLVQGFAEFFPISSSGHLSILNNLFDLSTADGGHLFFDVLLQFGTFAAVIVSYWQEISRMFREGLGILNLGPMVGERQKHYPGARLLLMIIVATLPMALLVPMRENMFLLFYKNIFVGIMLVLGGCVLYVSDRMTQGNKTERNITILDAVIIGLCQCAGAIPGMSRAGTTITAGIAAGLRADFALKFSFLLSLPSALGTSIFTLSETLQRGIDLASVPAYLIGMVVAMVSGIISIRLFRRIFERGKFGSFSYYCWVVGVLSIILSTIF